MSDTIINWLFGLVKTIPEDIIKGLILGFFTFVFRNIVNKVNCLNSKIRNFMVKILALQVLQVKE